MTIGLVLVLLGLVGLDRAIAVRPASPVWLSCAALAMLPLGYAPFGALALLQIMAVPVAAFWLGLAVCAALLARAARRLRGRHPTSVLALGCALAALAILLVLGVLQVGPGAVQTSIPAQDRGLFAAWIAAIAATIALCAAAILAAKETGHRPAMIAPAAIALAALASLLSL
jgi:hypothetical protein